MSDAPDFTGTTTFQVWRSHDSGLKCSACGEWIDPWKGHLSILNFRICTDCACAICFRANDESLALVRIDGQRYKVHELCRESVIKLSHHVIRAEDSSKPIDQLAPPGRYKLRNENEDYSHSRAVNCVAEALPEVAVVPPDTLASLAELLGTKDRCAACHRHDGEDDKDRELIFVRGVPLHRYRSCSSCDACEEPLDELTVWTTDGWSLCAYCFTHLYEPCPDTAEGSDDEDEAEDSE